MSRATFTGAAADYLPKPDNSPAPVAEPNDFRELIPLTEAESSAARLAYARWQRERLLEAPAAATTGVKP